AKCPPAPVTINARGVAAAASATRSANADHIGSSSALRRAGFDNVMHAIRSAIWSETASDIPARYPFAAFLAEGARGLSETAAEATKIEEESGWPGPCIGPGTLPRRSNADDVGHAGGVC